MKVVKGRFNRRFALAASLIGTAAIVAALAFGGVASKGSAGTANNILKMTVVPTTKGPLTRCTALPCGPETTAHYFLYLDNKTPLPPNWGRDPHYTRVTLPGAFVLSSVDLTVFVNGEVLGSTLTFIPPPDIAANTGGRPRSGHWPATVTCPDSPTDPCNIVGNPAILPGEKTVAYWERWTHGPPGPGEPNGTYVFRFTIHGTLDGAPVDLTADSPQITMTD